MRRVDDLFEVRYGHSLELNRLEQCTDEPRVAFVSRTAKNNGVSAWVRPIAGLDPAPAGSLSVSLGGRNYTLETSLQVNKHYCGRDVSYLIAREPMTEAEKLWWAMCIRSNRYRFSYGRQANRTLATLLLPDEAPSWVTSRSTPELGVIASHSDNGDALGTEKWKGFTFDDVFQIERGERFLKRDLQPGETPYIRATAYNNGVTQRVALAPTFPAGVITLACNGSVGEAFYQPDPFVASDDIAVLTPKESASAAACLFACTVIRQEKYRFSYGRKWFTARLSRSTLSLPVNADGRPDWDFADRYMRGLPVSALALP